MAVGKSGLPTEPQGACLPIGNIGISGMARMPRRGASAGGWVLLWLLWVLALPLARAESAAPDRHHYTVSGWTMEEGLPHPLGSAVSVSPAHAG